MCMHLSEVAYALVEGEMAAAELGFDPVAAITTGVHATLARCLHTLNVIRTIGMFHEGTIPRKVASPLGSDDYKCAVNVEQQPANIYV